MSNRQPETEPVQSFAYLYLSLFLVGSSLASLRGARCRGGDPGYAAAYSTSQVRSLFTRSVDVAESELPDEDEQGERERESVNDRGRSASIGGRACSLPYKPCSSTPRSDSSDTGHRTPTTNITPLCGGGGLYTRRGQSCS